MRDARFKELRRAIDDDTPLNGGSSPESRAVPYGRFRSAALAISALGAALLVTSEHRWQLVGVLCIAAVVQQLLTLSSQETGDINQAVVDLAITASLTAIDPTLWHAGTVLSLASITWLGIRYPIRQYMSISLLSLGVLTVVGALAGAPAWLAVSGVSSLVLLLFGWRGVELRSAMTESQANLQEVLLSSGSMVHFSILGDNGTNWSLGPVEELTGWTPEEWAAMDHRTLLHPDSSDYWLNTEDAIVGQLLSRTGRIRRKDGSYLWLRDNSRVVETRDGGLAIRGFSFDITEIEEANAYIKEQARRDQLTGLPNRFALEADLLRLQRNGALHAVLILDMNRFKEINDTLGHTSGDAVLRHLADRLRDLSRTEDLVCRLGGDEFAIVLRSIRNQEHAVAVAERMSTACAQPYEVGELTVVAPVSIGIAITTNDPAGMTDADHESQIAGTLRKADVAMYEAKRSGVPYMVFSDDLEQVSVEQLSLTAAISGALDRDEFVLHFQPKIHLETNEIVGVEGLARWEHPTRGTLAPGAFLDLVMLSSSYQRFTDRIIDQGAEFVATARAAGFALPVAVNISVRSLHDPQFVDRFRQAVRRHRIAPCDLVLEITEQDLHRESSGSNAALVQLAQIGVEISIDDFGTGHSSLQRLRELTVHELKIDRAFVSAIQNSEQDQVLAQSIIDLADRLKLRVVAEGVEYPDERDLLIKMGCDVAQGYLFARPLPAHEVLDMLTDESSSFTGRRLLHHNRS